MGLCARFLVLQHVLYCHNSRNQLESYKDFVFLSLLNSLPVDGSETVLS